MREQLVDWARTYPKNPPKHDPAFAGTPIRELVTRALPAAIRAAVPETDAFAIRGGIGEGRWTNTPWVALLDPAAGAEDGVYPVYLLSSGCQRLYLSIAQGCTALYNSLGKRMAASELRRRAELLRPYALSAARRLSETPMTLSSKSWRGPLYEAGSVVAVEYEADRLPSEEVLIADLQEAIDLYARAMPHAVWGDSTAVLQQAREERGVSSFEEAKRYAYHRRAERRSSIPRKVKNALGCKCEACKIDVEVRYGPTATGLIEAHHLQPLAQLKEGERRKVTVDDFAVLCPSCHRAIHRMADPADVAALQAIVANYSVT